MATSGTIYGTTSNSNISVEIDWVLEQSISGNYSKITATLHYWYNDNYPSGHTYGTGWWGVIINGVDSGGDSVYASIDHNGEDVLSNAVTVSHNADGTCGDVTISGYGSISGTTLKSTSVSGSISIPTIPRATTPGLSTSSTDMGNAVTIDLTGAASDSFTHDLTYQLPNGATGTIATGLGRTTKSWTIPDFASSIPNAAAGTVAITCVTKQGGTVIGTKTVYLTANVPAGVVPVISAVSVAEATDGIAAQFGAYIQSKSKLAVAVTAAGAKGSTISAYSTTLQGKAYGGASFTSDVLTVSGSVSLVTTVTDSRGRTATKTTAVTVLAYTPPQISVFSAYRVNASGSEDASGDYAAVRYAYSVPTLNGGNTAAMAVKYKRATASDYNDTLLTGTALSADETDKPATEISSDYRWDLKITVTDYFGAVSSAAVQLPSGEVILDIKADGKGFAFFKTAEQDGLDIAGDVIFRSPKSPLASLYGQTLLERTSIPSNANLNNYTTVGCYAVAQNATAASLSNCPTSIAFVLDVYNATGGTTPSPPATGSPWLYFGQRITDYGGNKFYRLISYNGSLSPSYGQWYKYTMTAV